MFFAVIAISSGAQAPRYIFLLSGEAPIIGERVLILFGLISHTYYKRRVERRTLADKVFKQLYNI